MDRDSKQAISLLICASILSVFALYFITMDLLYFLWWAFFVIVVFLFYILAYLYDINKILEKEDI